jgi:hypothetical protein
MVSQTLCLLYKLYYSKDTAFDSLTGQTHSECYRVAREKNPYLSKFESAFANSLPKFLAKDLPAFWNWSGLNFWPNATNRLFSSMRTVRVRVLALNYTWRIKYNIIFFHCLPWVENKSFIFSHIFARKKTVIFSFCNKCFFGSKKSDCRCFF